MMSTLPKEARESAFAPPAPPVLPSLGEERNQLYYICVRDDGTAPLPDLAAYDRNLEVSLQ